jgi:magnesium transporter
VSSALLFNRDEVDEVEDWSAEVDRLGRRSILWIDLERSDRAGLETLVDLELDDETRDRLLDKRQRAYFGDFGTYVHVTAFVPTNGEGSIEPVPVDCLISKNWVVTVRETELEVLDQFRERVTSSSGEVGRLDGPEFLANLLAWVLEAYLGAFEAIELELETFDERVMRGRHEDAEDELARLVDYRKQIGRLRRALVAHRGMFLALTHPELEAITTSDHAERFKALRGQLEEVVQVARDSRDATFGSFDVLIARSERRTNEIMKVLTLGTFLFLPGALLAGVLGMNFRLGFFDTGWYFWVACAAIVGIAATALAVARLRKWI